MDNHKILLANLGLEASDIAVCARTIDARIEEARERILDMPFNGVYGVYVGHSGGKDSVLVRWLVDQTLDNVPTVHTPKPKGVKNEVHPLTKEFLYGLNRHIHYIPDGCIETSEFAHFVTQIDGTRAAEATRRDGRDVGLIIEGKEVSRAECPLYLEKGLFGKQYVYPIYDWSDLEVWAAILTKNIPFSREYYVI
jgi:3'-phosphoadenosine 5'-phosphosulfate sulfotransferase (PAPS reductase)/FAD synthetase